ncbi:MAG: DUF3422 family protein [Gammaproteobacteria bacterium]|jgi:uncharacterized membrane-anchored protein|nr:DUF3422 family protein [Gammaproteobacteria bacterium]
MAMAFHPDHSCLIGELHSRPHFAFGTPAILTHLAILPARNEAGLKPRVEALCQQFGQEGPNDDRHHSARLGALVMRWERHTEFESIAVIRPGASPGNDGCPLEELPDGWLDSLSGRIVSGARITVHPPDATPLKPRAGQNPVVGGLLLAGAAELCTDLRADERGFVHFHLGLRESVSAERTGRLVQRLIEVETYRMMALLGLPTARGLGPNLDGLENRLVDLVGRLGRTEDLTREQALLDELFDIAQSSEELLSAHAFRFSATAAYGRLVGDRLEELDERPTPGRQALSEFLSRRFEPALRTCQAIRDRQEDLSRRISRTADLARTRVDVALQKQNRSLLSSMARRARMQLRLQQTVEGLSVMAIGYYSIGILAYLLGGWIPSDALKLALSALAPVVLITIWWLLRRWRRRLDRDTPGGESPGS